MDWGVVPWGIKHMCEYIQKDYEPEGLLFETALAILMFFVFVVGLRQTSVLSHFANVADIKLLQTASSR